MPPTSTISGVDHSPERPVDIRIGVARDVLICRALSTEARKALADLYHTQGYDALEIAVNPLYIQDAFRAITERGLRFVMDPATRSSFR